MTSLLSRLVRPKPPTTVSETVTLPEHLKSKLLIADPQHAGMAVVLLAVGVASYVMSKSDVVSDDASEHYYFDHSEQKREAAKGTEPVAVDNKNEDAESLLKKHGKKHKGPKYNEVKPDHAHVPLGKPQKDNAGPQRPAPTPQTLDQIVQDLQKLQNSAAVLLDSCKMKAKAITERINRVGVLLDTVPLPDDVRVDSEDFRYIKITLGELQQDLTNVDKTVVLRGQMLQKQQSAMIYMQSMFKKINVNAGDVGHWDALRACDKQMKDDNVLLTEIELQHQALHQSYLRLKTKIRELRA